MKTSVYAFAKVPEVMQGAIYNAIRAGKSRFGMWEQEVSLREEHYGANAFLLRINPGDWVVHVNLPCYGRCIAVQVTGEYGFDEGLNCDWGRDFSNYLPVAPNPSP